MSCKGWREDFESPAKRSPVVSESHRNTDGQELWLRSGSSLLVCCYAFDMDLLEHVIDQTYYYCPKWKNAVASVAAVALFSMQWWQWKVQQKRIRYTAGFKSKQRLNRIVFLMCSITVAFYVNGKWSFPACYSPQVSRAALMETLKGCTQPSLVHTHLQLPRRIDSWCNSVSSQCKVLWNSFLQLV